MNAVGEPPRTRRCFRDPIPEIFEVAHRLNAAVSAHLAQRPREAAQLFFEANSSIAREWLESIWGKSNKDYVKVTKLPAPVDVARVKARMPTKEQVAQLHVRDGFHCRFCGIPVIRPAVRKHAVRLYPDAVPWGRTNPSQHAGFQVLWAQYDHVVPHAFGGTNELDNLVVTCAGCNFGKMSYRLEELGLLDPRDFSPLTSAWDGIERFID